VEFLSSILGSFLNLWHRKHYVSLLSPSKLNIFNYAKTFLAVVLINFVPISLLRIVALISKIIWLELSRYQNQNL
jgi:hypothetical protein